MKLSKIIQFTNVSKFYEGHKTADVSNISFHIKQGECFVLIGSSGSGKTTLLKMLNRLEEPTSGKILIKNKDIKSYKIHDLRRNFFGYVFQKIGLFPHMTAKENIEIILRITKKPKNTHKKRIHELLELMHLDPKVYSDRYPELLSGGEQQRIGIARALAAESECLLMDEPFGALDAVTRSELQDELLNLKKNFKKTIIFVTHDIMEAFKIGDRIAVMKDGKIDQIGTKEELCNSPKTFFVERLIQTGMHH